MSWLDVATHAIGLGVGLLSGAYLRKFLEGKTPPAPRSTWTDIRKKVDADDAKKTVVYKPPVAK